MPTVFISYSWADADHKFWVRDFVRKLRENGVDARLDQAVKEALPGTNLPYFMETEIASADHILLICTPTYKEKFDARAGGVGYEATLMTSGLLTEPASRRCIPILRDGEHRTAVPMILQGNYALDFRDPISADKWDTLMAALHPQLAPTPVPLGPVPPRPKDPSIGAFRLEGEAPRSEADDSRERFLALSMHRNAWIDGQVLWKGHFQEDDRQHIDLQDLVTAGVRPSPQALKTGTERIGRWLKQDPWAHRLGPVRLFARAPLPLMCWAGWYLREMGSFSVYNLRPDRSWIPFHAPSEGRLRYQRQPLQHLEKVKLRDEKKMTGHAAILLDFIGSTSELDANQLGETADADLVIRAAVPRDFGPVQPQHTTALLKDAIEVIGALKDDRAVQSFHLGLCMPNPLAFLLGGQLHALGGFQMYERYDDHPRYERVNGVWIGQDPGTPERGKASASPTPGASSSSAPQTDIAIFVALEEELEILYEMIPGAVEPRKDERHGGVDYVFEHPSEDGRPYRAVARFVDSMGPSATGLDVDRIIDRLNPATVIMVGIAAGLDDDLALGDVVSAVQIDGYANSLKAVPGKGDQLVFEHRGQVFAGHHGINQDLANFRFAHRNAYQTWLNAGEADVADLLQKRGALAYLETGLARKAPKIHRVHLASGPIVGASEAFRKWLLTRDHKIQALEMEAIGLVQAAERRRQRTPVLVLRGISDRGNEEKADVDAVGKGAFRKLAMRNTVRLLWGLLSAGLVPRHR